MKKILLILCLFPILVFSQKSYKIPADSTILNNIGSGKNELVIRNATSNITGGVLTNLGNGVTAFVLGGGSERVVDTIYKNSAKDSIVFTISGIRYAVKDSTGGGGVSQTLSISGDTLSISNGNSLKLPSTIFPNGAKLVETDRTLQADDAGYALLLSDGVQLTIPTICPLSPGQYFGITTNSATASFISEGNPSELAVYLSYAGQEAALVNEVVTYVAADVGGSTSLILLTQIAGSNDTIMTANRYFFEQLQNVIPGGGGASLSGLTAATATNTINNANFGQEWQWNSLTSGTGLKLSSTSTGAASNTQSIFDVYQSGANATSGQTTYGAIFSNTHTGTSSTNIAAKFSASGATNNYAAIFENGNVGIGTTAPASLLDILGSGNFWGLNIRNSSVGALFQVSGGKAGFVGFNGSAYNNLDIRCGVSTQIFLSTNGNVGIGTATPVASAILDLTSTTQGFLPPRMTATQASAISSPAKGLILYSTDTNGTFTSAGLWMYNGTVWKLILAE